MNENQLRMGRISYLNVLPIYHAIETNIIDHEFELVSAPPAFLNNMMARGELHVSSCSCFEYARNPQRYYLVEDLSIGSHGSVMSVLLLSKKPISQLAGEELLISGESHTSVALLRLLMADRYKLPVSWKVGSITQAINSPHQPQAFLAIGDEALRLRQHPDYPYRVDLADAWVEWTGLPFIFGLWVIDAKAGDAGMFRQDPGEILRSGRDWGLGHMDIILDLTKYGCPLNRHELEKYYLEGLVYSLGSKEIAGLKLFYKMLADKRLINSVPELRFYNCG